MRLFEIRQRIHRLKDGQVFVLGSVTMLFWGLIYLTTFKDKAVLEFSLPWYSGSHGFHLRTHFKICSFFNKVK